MWSQETSWGASAGGDDVKEKREEVLNIAGGWSRDPWWTGDSWQSGREAGVGEQRLPWWKHRRVSNRQPRHINALAKTFFVVFQWGKVGGLYHA